jgi:acetyltransferase-like isoleucine patch superfamily enzyme
MRHRFSPRFLWTVCRLRWYRYLTSPSFRSLYTRNTIYQPVIFTGNGAINVEGVTFGWRQSPYFYSTYSYIEARNNSAVISIGAGTIINNGISLISEGAGIFIGEKCLIGPNVEIYDSDFHDLHPERRMTGKGKIAPITIGKNVFIGGSVKILKGIIIGDNAVIGQSAVVTKNVPSNAIVAGNPAKLIRYINDTEE